MPIHEAVLAAAQRLCANRATNEFAPDEVVRALPHLNPQSVRTHVTSRCCVNAAPHHQSRYEYLRKTARGRYELTPKYRTPVVAYRNAAHPHSPVFRSGRHHPRRGHQE